MSSKLMVVARVQVDPIFRIGGKPRQHRLTLPGRIVHILLSIHLATAAVNGIQFLITLQSNGNVWQKLANL